MVRASEVIEIDKSLVSRSFKKSIGTYDEYATVQEQICGTLVGLVLEHCTCKSFDNVLEIGAGTGLLTSKLTETFDIGHLTINDLVAEMEAPLRQVCGRRAGTSVSFMMGDAEGVDFGGGNNLLASASAIQWFTRPGLFFSRLHQLVSPGGFVAVSTFGPRNLEEVKQVSGRGLRYPPVDEILGFLPPSFSVLCAREDIIEIHLPSPMQVLSHVKNTGVNGINSKRLSRADISRFCQEYSERFPAGDGVKLTYQPLYLVAVRR